MLLISIKPHFPDIGNNSFLPHPPKLSGADTFQLLEYTTEIVQFSDAAFEVDFFDAFVRKPEHTFRMGDPKI